MVRLTGWRYVAFIGSFVGVLGVAVYAAIISPMINPEPYKQIRESVASQISSKKPN